MPRYTLRDKVTLEEVARANLIAEFNDRVPNNSSQTAQGNTRNVYWGDEYADDIEMADAQQNQGGNDQVQLRAMQDLAQELRTFNAFREGHSEVVMVIRSEAEASKAVVSSIKGIRKCSSQEVKVSRTDPSSPEEMVEVFTWVQLLWGRMVCSGNLDLLAKTLADTLD